MNNIKLFYKNYDISADKKLLVNSFINQKVHYAFGRNEHSKALCQTMKIDYVVDDFVPEGMLFEGAKVIKTQDIPKDAIIVNCVMLAYSVDVYNKLVEHKIKSVISYSDLCYVLPNKFSFPKFVLDTRKDFFENEKKYQQIFDSLEDKTSQKVLIDVLKYRLTGQYEFLSDYKVNLQGQYFEDFLNLSADEIFVDCGGFDGETTQEFIKRCPEYERVYFFEPSRINIEKAKKRLVNNTNIDFILKGVSNKGGILKFNSSLGSASGISDSGNDSIEVVTIDEYINKKYTFLKMDLEG